MNFFAFLKPCKSGTDRYWLHNWGAWEQGTGTFSDKENPCLISEIRVQRHVCQRCGFQQTRKVKA